MTKKDFIALADYIRVNRDAFTDETIKKLADFCKSQNAAFLRERWIGYINGENGKNGGNVKRNPPLET